MEERLGFIQSLIEYAIPGDLSSVSGFDEFFNHWETQLILEGLVEVGFVDKLL